MSFRNDDDFDSESYVRVNTRLAEFWTKHPEGRIETSYGFHEGVLVLTAKLFKTQQDTNPAATGHAFLERLDGDKVGEYTETVAVGRALALMGFQVEKSIASAEEMSRFKDRKEQREEAPRESKIKQSREPEVPKDTPEVPKTLKAARIFKPHPKKDAQTEE